MRQLTIFLNLGNLPGGFLGGFLGSTLFFFRGIGAIKLLLGVPFWHQRCLENECINMARRNGGTKKTAVRPFGRTRHDVYFFTNNLSICSFKFGASGGMLCAFS